MRTVTPHEQRIHDELKAVGISRYGLTKGESNRLPSIIHPDEHIQGAVLGKRDDVTAMLVATDRRVIYIDTKPFFSTVDELTYEVVAGVMANRAAPFTSVVLHTRLGDYALRFVNTKSAQKFVRYIENKRIEEETKKVTPIKKAPEVIPSDDARSFEFLQEHDLGVLSTVDRTGNVHGAVVHYTVENDGLVYIMTKSGTHKGRNVLANGQVALTVHEPDTLRTLQLQGMAEAETDQAKKTHLFNKLIKPRIYGMEEHMPPVTKLHNEGFMIIKITPIHLRYHDYAKD